MQCNLLQNYNNNALDLVLCNRTYLHIKYAQIRFNHFLFNITVIPILLHATHIVYTDSNSINNASNSK